MAVRLIRQFRIWKKQNLIFCDIRKWGIAYFGFTALKNNIKRFPKNIRELLILILVDLHTITDGEKVHRKQKL
jgi:hypothetical protein